jgi:hypothetical protein
MNVDTIAQHLYTHTDNHDALFAEAAQVIQSLDFKIASLEKVVQTLTVNHPEETSLHLDSISNPVLSQTGKDIRSHSDNVFDSSKVDDDELLSPEQIFSSVSETDLVSLDGNVSNEVYNDQVHSLDFTELPMAFPMESFNCDDDSISKDALIRILVEQVLRLKTCLEEILESERLYDDEYQRQCMD